MIFVDFYDLGGNSPGNGPPGDDFGAALGIPGKWNHLDVKENGTPVFDAGGNPARIFVTHAVGAQLADHLSTSGDVEKLLDDGIDIGNGFTFEISLTGEGLRAGPFELYTYAWHPASNGADVVTRVSVNGLPPQDVSREDEFSGFFQGETHAYHAGTLVADQGIDLVISATGVGTDPETVAVVNGFQLVYVPEAPTWLMTALGFMIMIAVMGRKGLQGSSPPGPGESGPVPIRPGDRAQTSHRLPVGSLRGPVRLIPPWIPPWPQALSITGGWL